MVANAAEASATQGYITAPRVGDIYEVNMAKLKPDEFPGGMWVVARVMHVEGNDVALVFAKTGYSQLQGVQNDVEYRQPPTANYYADYPSHTNPRALAAMLKDNVIVKVIRP